MLNVFDIWFGRGRVVPFKVRRWSWHSSSYFVVKEVVIRSAVRGRLYGLAFGDMYLRGKLVDVDIQLGCAGCYQWVEVV